MRYEMSNNSGEDKVIDLELVCEMMRYEMSNNSGGEDKVIDLELVKEEISSDSKFMAHLLSEICDYAVCNGMKPNDTIKTISNSFLFLLDIANFNGWKKEENNENIN